RNLQQLGLDAGATLPQIFERAVSVGLKLCPAYAGPYLRLDFLDQAASDDSVLSAGKKPAGSLTIASASMGGEDFPRGFYLRVVDEVAWLRGYRCDDTNGLGLAATFVFRCRWIVLRVWGRSLQGFSLGISAGRIVDCAQARETPAMVGPLSTRPEKFSHLLDVDCCPSARKGLTEAIIS